MLVFGRVLDVAGHLGRLVVHVHHGRRRVVVVAVAAVGGRRERCAPSANNRRRRRPSSSSTGRGRAGRHADGVVLLVVDVEGLLVDHRGGVEAVVVVRHGKVGRGVGGATNRGAQQQQLGGVLLGDGLDGLLQLAQLPLPLGGVPLVLLGGAVPRDGGGHERQVAAQGGVDGVAVGHGGLLLVLLLLQPLAVEATVPAVDGGVGQQQGVGVQGTAGHLLAHGVDEGGDVHDGLWYCVGGGPSLSRPPRPLEKKAEERKKRIVAMLPYVYHNNTHRLEVDEDLFFVREFSHEHVQAVCEHYLPGWWWMGHPPPPTFPVFSDDSGYDDHVLPAGSGGAPPAIHDLYKVQGSFRVEQKNPAGRHQDVAVDQYQGWARRRRHPLSVGRQEGHGRGQVAAAVDSGARHHRGGPGVRAAVRRR